MLPWCPMCGDVNGGVTIPSLFDGEEKLRKLLVIGATEDEDVVTGANTPGLGRSCGGGTRGPSKGRKGMSQKGSPILVEVLPGLIYWGSEAPPGVI